MPSARGQGQLVDNEVASLRARPRARQVIAADFRGQLERVLAEKEALSAAARAHAAELAAARGAAAQAAARAAAAEAAAGALRAEAARLRVECAGLSAEARRRPGASAGLGAGGSARRSGARWLAGRQAGRQEPFPCIPRGRWSLRPSGFG